MLTGENGVVDKASNASVKSREVKAKEEVSMAWTGVNGDYNTEWIENTNLNKVEYFSEEEGKIRLNKYLVDTGVITNGPTYSEGQYTLTYKTNDTGMEYIFSIDESGNITKKCGIILSKTTTKIIQDDEEQLEAILDGITGNIIWESSAPEIVSVTDGTIRALADSGSAIITAKIDGTIYKATCTVNIAQRVTSISAEDINIEQNDTTQIIIVTTPTGIIEDLNYTFESNDNTIATVNERGELVGMKPGIAAISITANNNDSLKTTCNVVVEKKLGYLKQDGTTAYYYPSLTSTDNERISIMESNMGQYLGMKVKYTPQGHLINSNDEEIGNGGVGTKTDTYRLFYVDINGKYGDGQGSIYLKADYDGVETLLRYLPSSSGNTVSLAFNPKWAKNSTFVSNPKENMQIVNCLLDKDIWSIYKDIGSYSIANYAVGAPSIEMWMDSYNTFLKSNTPINGQYQELCCSAGSSQYNHGYGYEVGVGGRYDHKGYYTSAGTVVTPSCYPIGVARSRCYMYATGSSAYWLSSPSSPGSSEIRYIYFDSVDHWSSNGRRSFCPIISCKPGVIIEGSI